MTSDPSQPPVKAGTVIRNIGQLVTIAQQPIAEATGPLQVISNAALAVHDGMIVWIGSNDLVETMFQQDTGSRADGITIVDAQGVVVTPGFVDSHTHLVFAGDRAEEFHLRRAGGSYGELLAQGYGILTTVNATRSADAETLTKLAITRLNTMRQYGTTTIEGKKSYWLEKITEKTRLPIINKLNAQQARSTPRHKQRRVSPKLFHALVF